VAHAGFVAPVVLVRSAVLGVLGVAVLVLGSFGGAASAEGDPRTYRPPVLAPVTDPFRPPPHPWLPGNRGLEYATVPGTRVGAIGPGRVVFAGPVAGSLHVTVRHPDGLRSSYSFLAVVRVAVGDRVEAGQVVGIAGARFHLGVRRGTTYLDPAALWGRRVGGGRVHLVPIGGGHQGRGALEGRRGTSLHSNVGPPPGGAHHTPPPVPTQRSSSRQQPVRRRERASQNRWERRGP
jgi:murein DD-endopeptidase MepM/ murein hydrolase activator NlpD